MNYSRLLLSAALIVGIGGAAYGCVSSDSVDNDRTTGKLGDDKGTEDETEDDTASDDETKPAPTKDAGSSAMKDSGKAPVTETPDDDEDTTPIETPQGDAGAAAPSDSGADPVDTGTEPMMTEPEPEPAKSVVPGSATTAKCSSYGKANGNMCAGYFCGVTQEDIEREMPKDTICGDNAVIGACDNKLPTAVAKCAREVKSANALASNAENRPKVQDCVFKDAELKEKTPLPCMSCFLDAAECAGDKCLVDCLAGDSKGCDSCRAKNNCDKKVFECAKIISPF